MTAKTPNPWFTVFLLALVFACSQLDRQIMGILLEPIKHDLKASDSQMGFLVGLAFAVFYTFLGIPVAMLADRGNRKNIIAASIILWSGMTALCGSAMTYTQMALARIGVAVGEAGSGPASVSIISSLFDERSRATAIGFFFMGSSIGVLLAFLGGGFLSAEIGWRTTFVVIGLPGIVVGIIVLIFLKEPPRPQGLSSEPVSLGETVRCMAGNPATRHLLAGNSLAGFVSYGLILWVPSFLVRSHGLAPAQVGLTLALSTGVGGALGAVLSGRVSDWAGKHGLAWRPWSIAIAKLLCVPLLLGFLLSDSIVVAMAFYIIPAVIGGFFLAPTAALVQQLVDVRMRAVAAAILSFLINIVGMGMGPQGVGLLSDALAPSLGASSLRYALAAFVCVNLWSAFHFWRAGTVLKQQPVPPQAEARLSR